MYASFKAADDPIVIDTRHGENRKSTRVEYKSETGLKLFLWERVDQDPWDKIYLYELQGRGDPAQTADWQKYGTFTTRQIKPGQTYCLRAYLDPRIDPNKPTSDKGDEFCLLALKKDPDTRALLDTYEVESGGTWVSVTAAGAVPVAWIVEVGEGDPVATAAGLRSFPNPLAREVDARFKKVAHFELVDNLLAGNSYSILGRAVNALGDWEERIDRFTLLKRKVNLDLTNLHIINDSDPRGTGTASFTILVIEGAPGISGLLKEQWDFGGEDYKIWDQQDIPLSYSTTIGPEILTPETTAVDIWVIGEEYDGFLESNEVARNWYDPMLEFPRGSNQEQVVGAPFAREAVPVARGDDFQFRLEGTYSVTYT